ncbi:hypothetical protein IL306_008224 [Fusarium sp. DS 682]|nr:hypothetical protein IL306_008224 [Fusarium sp. DS 682]
MPVCVFCYKFLDAGLDCGEHGDIDYEDHYEALCVDFGDAIMVGNYPKPSTHSYGWELRDGVLGGIELPSLRDAGVTMDWFTEQLRIEQEWAKLYPHTLSPIAQSGIMFIMSTSAPLAAWDKIKCLILVNKYLNGLVEGQTTEGNETRLICSPWPKPDLMPNIDLDGTDRPSPLKCPKANLQEIFLDFFDHIFWTRASDVYSFKGQSRANSYYHVRQMYPSKAQFSAVLGCHLFASQPGIGNSPSEIILYKPANDGSERLKPEISLKNAQMGSNPAPFINPAVLSWEYERDHPYWSRWPQRKPWELKERHSYYSTDDPAMEQMVMLAQIEYLIDNRRPYRVGKVSDAFRYDLGWQTQPQYPLLCHPRTVLVHTNNGLGPKDKPLNAVIGPSGIPRAPNFGNKLQPARTEVPGQTFQLALAQSHPVALQFGILSLNDDEMQEDDSVSSGTSDSNEEASD